VRRVLALASAIAASACASAVPVQRAYDGAVIQGRFIEPEAYAAFLRGALAEAAGDSRGALDAYADAAKLDPRSPELLTRTGEVRCRLDPHDARAQAAFAEALDAEPRYARAWAARAKCLLAGGQEASARAAARKAAELDPSADGANILLARTAAGGRDPATRETLVALTVTARDPLVAWDALATWAQSRGDVALWVRALRETVRISPGRRSSVALAVDELAGAGEIGEARAVAAALVDADVSPLPSGNHALASRLALDEAILRRDAEAVRRRATRTRLELEEAAGRALLAGETEMARELASEPALGDPTSRGARLVLAASRGGDVVGAATDARADDAPTSASAFVAFGMALAHAMSPDQAHVALAAIAHDAIGSGDDLLVRPAVQLVSRGALGADALPPSGIVELAASRSEPLPDAFFARGVLDARHEYLAFAIARPTALRTGELGRRLTHASGADPVVAAAAALVQLATGHAIDPGAPRALLAIDPGDPLLASTALRLAEKVGDSDVARRARAALTALGGTPPRTVE